MPVDPFGAGRISGGMGYASPMSTARHRPVCNVTLQTGEPNEEGLSRAVTGVPVGHTFLSDAPAIQLSSDSYDIDGSVEQAHNEEEMETTLALQIRNVDLSTVDSLLNGGLLRVEAGYVGGSLGAIGMRTIYQGSLDYGTVEQQHPDDVLILQSTWSGELEYSMYLPRQYKAPSGKFLKCVDVMRLLLQELGGTLVVSGVPRYGRTPGTEEVEYDSTFSTMGTLGETLTLLTKVIQDGTRTMHRLVRLNSGGIFDFMIIALPTGFDPGQLPSEVKLIEVDVADQKVIDAQPTISKTDADDITVDYQRPPDLTNFGLFAFPSDASYVLGYSLVTVFDPRFDFASMVNLFDSRKSDKPIGSIAGIHDVRHEFTSHPTSPWTTAVSGLLGAPIPNRGES